MTDEDFKTSASFIAKRNVSENIVQVFANFDGLSGHLSITYITYDSPSEDDSDDCELTCGELLAAFPEIRTAQTKCLTVEHFINHGTTEPVYSRKSV